MSLVPFLCVAVGAFLLLHFVVLPLVRRNLERTRDRRIIGLSGLLALCGFLRGLALIAAFTTGITILAVIYMNGRGGATVDEVEQSVHSVQGLRERIVGFGTGWGIVVSLLLLLGLGVYARRRGRQRLESEYADAEKREFEALVEKLQRGELEERPPDEAMKEALGALANLQALKDSGSVTEPDEVQLVENHIEQVQAVLLHLDLRRRMSPRLDPADVPLPEPRNLWQRLQMFFISRGLYASLGGVSRAVFLLGYLLLIPSLLGIYSGVTVRGRESVAEQKLVELASLRVQLTADGARADWEQARTALGEPERPLTEDEEEVVDAYADAVERAFATSEIWGEVEESLPAGSSFRLASMGVRQQILRRAAAVTPRSVAPAGAMTAADVELSAPERRVARTAEMAGSRQARGEAAPLRRGLKDVAVRKPAVVQRMRTALASFQEPMTVRGLRGELARRSVGAVLQGTDMEAGRAMARMWETQMNSSLRDIARGEAPEQVLKRARSGRGLEPLAKAPDFVDVRHQYHAELRNHADLDAVHRKLSQKPPTLDMKSAPSEAAATRSRATTRYQDAVARRAGRIDPMRGTSPISTYRDHFPGQVRADLDSVRGRLVTDRLKKTVSSRAGRTQWMTRHFNSGRAVARARSFVRLRGFSRIGGVLIGREPADASARLEVSGFDWERAPDGRIRLTFQTADGVRATTPWHRRNIVFHALSYAADGRATTVTMIDADPLPELKILVHPTLVDSPLGYRVIELDRFVDIYAANAFREEAIGSMTDDVALYRWAWALRLTDVGAEALGGAFAPYLELASSILEEPDQRETVSRACTRSLDPKSLIAIKDLYFEPALVSAIRESCGADSLQSFEAGLRAHWDAEAIGTYLSGHRKREELVDRYNALVEQYNRSEGANLILRTRLETMQNEIEALDRRLAFAGDHAAIYAVPPTFQVWSGVREREFRLSAEDLVWAEDRSRLRFMLQVAFTSSPTFGAAAEAEEGDVVPDDPWTFPSIAERIDSEVRLALRDPAHREHAIVLSDCEEFTALQRLFRCAFDGYLGEGFPIERLGRLAEITAPSPQDGEMRTPRWNVREGSLEGTIALAVGLGRTLVIDQLEGEAWERAKSLFAVASELAGECRSAVAAVAEAAEDSEGWPDAWRRYAEGVESRAQRWSETAAAMEKLSESLSAESRAATVLNQLLESLAALQLRHSLDVSADFRLALERSGLPPLPE